MIVKRHRQEILSHRHFTTCTASTTKLAEIRCPPIHVHYVEVELCGGDGKKAFTFRIARGSDRHLQQKTLGRSWDRSVRQVDHLEGCSK